MNPDDIFKCIQCGDCCRGYGGTVVSEADIAVIAAYVGVDGQTFKTRYCRHSGNKLILAQGNEGYCIFWDRICTIHAVKPRMCREWPYLKSVLTEIDNWRIMAGFCPGMSVDAPDHLIRAVILKQQEKG